MMKPENSYGKILTVTLEELLKYDIKKKHQTVLCGFLLLFVLEMISYNPGDKMKITKKQLKKMIKESLGYTPTNKHIFMLIGPPSIGKSTWIRENVPGAFVISSDETVEAAAKKHGFTYDDLFAGYPTQQEIAANYTHPKYGPIGKQQIGWKSFKPKAFQFTNTAEKEADDELERLKSIATQSGKPIVVDMTNTSAHIRKMVMDKINPGPEFIKVGVIFFFAY